MPSLEHTQPERRHLTVMFCDLADFTALSDQIDPEDLRDVILAYQKTCEDVVRNYGGHIAQYLGDGILVYFGFPSARENDAQRAVVSALKIVDRICDLPLPHGIKHTKLQVRIGIHSGEVVVGEMGGAGKHEYLAVGSTPNIASKVQHAAGINEVVITSVTAKIVHGIFDIYTIGQLSVNGTGLIGLYKVAGEKKLYSRFDTVLSRELTPFVGKEKELNLLLDGWEEVKRGSGQAVLITGDAGIGKSRLTYEFRNAIDKEAHITQTCQCLPEFQNSAFYPLTQCLLYSTGISDDDPDNDKINKLELFLAERRIAADEALPLLSALLSIELGDRYSPLQYAPAKIKEKTIELIIDLISLEAKTAAFLLIIEDMQWMDPSTHEFLGKLMERLVETRLCIVITARPEFDFASQLSKPYSIIALIPLQQKDVETIVSSIDRDNQLSQETVKEVVKKSDGVPLFVEEIAKTLLESGQSETNHSLKSNNIPSSLRDLLTARLDWLGKAKEIAQVGSIVSGTFSQNILEFFEMIDERELNYGLLKLLDAGLLVEINSDEVQKYDFKHALIREAAYGSILKARKLALHKKYAEILEEKFPNIIENNPEIPAYHFTKAELPDKAIPYWTIAGKKAHLRFALDEAINHINNALVLVKKLPENSQHIEQELNLQLNLGLVWCDKNSFTGPEVERAFFRALELSEKIGNEFLRFHTLYGLTYYYCFVNVKMAHQLIDEMRKIGESTNNPEMLATYVTSKGTLLTWEGELELSLEYLDKAISICGSNRDNTVHYMDRTLNNLGYKTLTLCIMGFPDRANKHFYDSKIVSDTNIYQIWSLLYETLLHQLRNDHELTKRLSGELIELSTSYGQLYCICTGKILRGWSLSQEGNLIDGIDDMKKGIDVFKELGMILIIPYYVGLLVEAYLKLGEIETALKLLDEEMDDIMENGLLWHEPEFNRLKGALLFAKLNETEAETHFRKAIESAQRQKAKLWELRAIKDYCRLMMKQGRHKEAKEKLSGIYNWFTEGFDTKDLIEAKALLDELSQN